MNKLFHFPKAKNYRLVWNFQLEPIGVVESINEEKRPEEIAGPEGLAILETLKRELGSQFVDFTLGVNGARVQVKTSTANGLGTPDATFILRNDIFTPEGGPNQISEGAISLMEFDRAVREKVAGQVGSLTGMTRGRIETT